MYENKALFHQICLHFHTLQNQNSRLWMMFKLKSQSHFFVLLFNQKSCTVMI